MSWGFTLEHNLVLERFHDGEVIKCQWLLPLPQHLFQRLRAALDFKKEIIVIYLPSLTRTTPPPKTSVKTNH